MANFAYNFKSNPVFYNGYLFDSLIELKYAMMIEETHAWLRDGLEIYYGVNIQPSGIKSKLHCYRPDFLIRSISSGVAELIEIKPDGFTRDALHKRKKIVEKFVTRFAYDWSFRIVTESEITLSPDQWFKYYNILATQNDWQHKPGIKLLQNTTSLSDQEYKQYVITGLLPAFVP